MSTASETYLLIRLGAEQFDEDGDRIFRNMTANRDRIFIVHEGAEIDVSHLCRSWAAAATVDELRTATVQFLFPRIVEGNQ